MTALTVLQLDTHFVRVPGDVASPDTYAAPIEILTIPSATIGAVVNPEPATLDITTFAAAIASAKGDVIVTSCGFLAPWQNYLASFTDRPLISSALIQLPAILPQHRAGQLGIMTYDKAVLRMPAYKSTLAGFDGPFIGLPPHSHLRQIIDQNRHDIDQPIASAELVDILAAEMALQPLDGLLLECTNLPPYKAALRSHFDIKIYDILRLIEAASPNLVVPDFL